MQEVVALLKLFARLTFIWAKLRKRILFPKCFHHYHQLPVVWEESFHRCGQWRTSDQVPLLVLSACNFLIDILIKSRVNYFFLKFSVSFIFIGSSVSNEGNRENGCTVIDQTMLPSNAASLLESKLPTIDSSAAARRARFLISSRAYSGLSMDSPPNASIPLLPGALSPKHNVITGHKNFLSASRFAWPPFEQYFKLLIFLLLCIAIASTFFLGFYYKIFSSLYKYIHFYFILQLYLVYLQACSLALFIQIFLLVHQLTLI